MRKIKVARFDLYPPANPDSYVVGFAFEANGNRGYLEAVIPITEVVDKADDEIVNYALLREIEVEDEPNTSLGKIINERLLSFQNKPSIVGTPVELPVQN
jgi:hypothetical protein